jgi:hypothetical protein
MHVSVNEHKINTTNIRNKLDEWVERIGEIANEICSDPDCMRINLKLFENS